MMTNVSIDRVLQILGSKEVEIAVLRDQVYELQRVLSESTGGAGTDASDSQSDPAAQAQDQKRGGE